MSAENLRRKYLSKFKGYRKNTRVAGWAIIANFVLQIVAAILAGHYLLSLTTSFWTVAGSALLMIFIATRLRGLNNIVHECSHATFVSDRQDNVRMGSFCASFVLGCFRDYKREHLTHHAHLGDYEHDLDLQGIEDLRLHDPLTARTILRHVFTPLTFRHLPYYLHSNLTRGDGVGFQLMKIALLLGAIGLAAIFPFTAILFIILPYGVIYSALNYWADCMDHAGLIHSGNELHASRNILAPAWLRLLFFPRNDCFHLVHHLFPQIPSQYLAETHATLSNEQIYQSKPNAVSRLASRKAGATKGLTA